MGILFAHAPDEWNNICYFWTRCGVFLNGWSTLWERSCQERWKIIKSSHTFLTLWISIVFIRTLDEDILMIIVQTERNKSPKWSLEFDSTKIKMSTGEDKRWRSVSRRWSFIDMNHGLYIETIVRHAIVYEKEILSLSWFSFHFEVKFSSYFLQIVRHSSLLV